MAIENWKRLPRVMFAKAWVVTGHVEKEHILELQGLTENDRTNSHILQDPAGLHEFLGVEASAEPSIADLIENGQRKRRRVAWSISSKSADGSRAMLPASLVWAVEKKLANYIYAKIDSPRRPPVPTCTLVLSRKHARECSFDVLRKNTELLANGTRKLREDASRGKKD